MKSVFDKAKKYVNKILLPLGDYYYHSYDHALDVMSRSMYLGEKEGLREDEIEMLGLAGLFHDTGFIIQYDNNEIIGAKIAQNYLKSIGYKSSKIKTIEELIIATDHSHKAKNIMEEIIQDADMDNLGREDFLEKNHDIKKELELVKKIKIKDPDWIHASAQLLQENKFQTKSQREEREAQRIDNLKKIVEEIKNESSE